MRPVPEACRESMERARLFRFNRHRTDHYLRRLSNGRYCFGQNGYQPHTFDCPAMVNARRETRSILAALRALRRQEEAGILRLADRT